MHHLSIALALVIALSGCATWLANPPALRDRPDAPGTFAAALARGLPAAVGVYGVSVPTELATNASAAGAVALRRSTDRGERPPWTDVDTRTRMGAGFFVSADGLIATAAHVVTDAPSIVVKLPDQRVMTAELVAADADTDIALIRIAASLRAPPPLGSSASLRMGDWVLAVGEPYGLDRSVVAGIVGGRGRHFAEDGELLFIQTDLSLNPGNSGGPLLDMRGNIVGMNLRTIVGPFGTPGLSLSVPIEIVRQIVNELASHGRITRPRLGAGFEDVSPFAALAAGRTHANGALISSVSAESLAWRIGLRAKDIVVGMNGRPIGDSADLARVLLSWRSASGTKITVFREGRYQQLVMD